MLPRFAGPFLALLALLPFIVQCRATNPAQEAELQASEDRTWFDAYGDTQECGANPPKDCPVGSYDPKYVDACVAKGFQAKSCGCIAVCSGKLVTKVKEAKVAVAVAEPGKPTCAEADRKAIDGIAVRKTSEVSHCIAAHLCQGDARPCTSSAKTISSNLRQLARGACKDYVIAKFCDADAFKDTLQCPGGAVDVLSRTYEDAYNKGDVKLRGCVREKMCDIHAGACAGSADSTAQAAAAAVKTPGCGYWLPAFCSLDLK